MTTTAHQPYTQLDVEPVTRIAAASPDQVWRVLADGWTYSSWVVGTARMRAVDDEFPSPGARLHHSFGAWPMTIDDETVCMYVEPVRRIVLEPHGGPLGTATVEITLEATAEGTRICLAEEAISGTGLILPTPARQAVIKARNTESLRRLSALAERPSSP